MKRIFLFGLAAIMLATGLIPVCAAEPVTAAAVTAAPVASACLSASGIQDALVAGRALRLADIRRKLKGDIVKADLCQDGGKLAYLVTVLTPEGMVRRVTVDASSGEMMYGRQ